MPRFPTRHKPSPIAKPPASLPEATRLRLLQARCDTMDILWWIKRIT